MNRYFSALAALCCIACHQATADQISPNPNPTTGDIFVEMGNTDFNAENPFDNHGYLSISFGGTLINNAGALLNNASEAHALLEVWGSLDNEGTLGNNGVIVVEHLGIINNSGNLNSGYIIAIRQGGTIVNNGTIDNKATSEIQNAGTIVTNGAFINDGSLSGSGTVVGSVNDSGVVAPGDAAAVHTIDGDWSKTGGSLEIELGGTSDGGGDKSLTEFDWVDVTGDVTLAGQLNVSLLDGFALDDFQQFPIINVGGSLTGQFDGLAEGALVGNFGRSLFITYVGGDGNDVALFTTNAIPEPSTLLLAAVFALCGGHWLRVRRQN
ncbi:hypothetical protein NG895_22650 [Aeoliella sp. ICT_H6.2]|uniref:PEP-CTERM protein-sorting domain-containing protein n=1 Tax=Aeoliella straminimaris TaxID=2954799 RepID=A0A9X2JIC8_9BACT|nr:hypothetical protein [Aeoliella straminimaris]MCO6046706.1 hypothetical protein [Aeoliella straminimaris]